MTVGEKIHELRIKNNMTMDDLARELGVQRSAINKYEKGIVVNLKRSTIAQLCRVFGVSPSYFLDDDPDDVAARLRVPPPGIVVPDNALFVKAMEKMSPEDMATLTGIFSRALAKIKEEEETTR